MRIGGLQKTTLIDFPGKIACTIFFQGCNYRCGYCHNSELVLDSSETQYTDEKILDFLDSRKQYLDGVCLSGGEPTLQFGLERFIRKIKDMDFAVKLDTNGRNFGVLQELREARFKKRPVIDYVAMDVKGPPQLYPQLVGRKVLDPRDDYQKSIAITTGFSGYEFRTTVVPVFRENGEASFMTVEEIVETAKLIYDCTGINSHKYFLQPFVVPKDGGRLVDSRLEKFPETPRELLEAGKEAAREYLPNCEIR